jgi:hypothetical protein
MLVVLLAIGASGPQAQLDGKLERVDLQPGEGGNACLDGSPYAYYVSRNQSSRDWVIDIEGGGWCWDLGDCAVRIIQAQTAWLASSKPWAASRAGKGITSANPATNPDYYTYNRVYFPYCDGSSFTGHHDNPIRYADQHGVLMDMYIRGWDNLNAALASLKSRNGMIDVGHLIVTGTSAGATSVLQHVDTIAQIVAPASIVGMPDAGVFRTVPKWADYWKKTVEFHHSVAHLKPTCVAHNQNEPWRCFTAEKIIPFVQSPLFVINTAFDHFQLSHFAENVNCANTQATWPPWNSLPSAACSAADNATIAEYGKGWKREFRNLIEGSSVGLFLPSCIAHELKVDSGWTGLQAGGVYLRDAFASWHRAVRLGGSALQTVRWKFIDECYNDLPCNLNREVCMPMAPEGLIHTPYAPSSTQIAGYLAPQSQAAPIAAGGYGLAPACARDTSSLCASWASMGLCSSLAAYMASACPTSCRLGGCTPVLVAPQGIVTAQTSSPVYYTAAPKPLYVPAAPVPYISPSAGTCVDTAQSCGALALSGYCRSVQFMLFMQTSCSKTCGLCTSTVPTAHVSPPPVFYPPTVYYAPAPVYNPPPAVYYAPPVYAQAPVSYSAPTVSNCVDSGQYCSVWAYTGQCRGSAYVQALCSLSCGVCTTTDRIGRRAEPMQFALAPDGVSWIDSSGHPVPTVDEWLASVPQPSKPASQEFPRGIAVALPISIAAAVSVGLAGGVFFYARRRKQQKGAIVEGSTKPKAAFGIELESGRAAHLCSHPQLSEPTVLWC